MSNNIVKINGGGTIEKISVGGFHHFTKKDKRGNVIRPSSKEEFARYRNIQNQTKIINNAPKNWEKKAFQEEEFDNSNYTKSLKFVGDLLRKIPKVYLPKRKLEKETLNRDMSDIIAPYMVNQAQKRLLSFILSKKELDDMMIVNTLAHMGVINTRCPGLNAPSYKTESYLDPLTGNIQCRKPIQKRRLTNAITCPDPEGDPLAIELYVDETGKGSCSRPVIRGDFQCPPHPSDKRKKRIVLGDGTGICVEPTELLNSPEYYPDTLWFPETSEEQMSDIVKQYYRKINTWALSPEQLILMKKTLESSDKDITETIINDPEVRDLRQIIPNAIYPIDLARQKYAYTHFMRSKHPDLFKKTFPDVSSYLSFMGIKDYH